MLIVAVSIAVGTDAMIPLPNSESRQWNDATIWQVWRATYVVTH